MDLFTKLFGDFLVFVYHCDEALGPMAVRMASFFPFQTTISTATASSSRS